MKSNILHLSLGRSQADEGVRQKSDNPSKAGPVGNRSFHSFIPPSAEALSQGLENKQDSRGGHRWEGILGSGLSTKK